MQKARRFTCSTVCQSSPSNTSERTRKQRRPYSIGGDSAKVRTSLGPALEDNIKLRSTKCNVSLLSSSIKPKRKAPKQSRPPKPNAGSLQNAVVLAPFYTLKKCFQNKLVDMYSQEKTKKANQKTQMAKKKNMSFEYDIIELKPLERDMKKERKSTKSKAKSRSTSYCQCNKLLPKEEQKLTERNSRQKRKASSRTSIFSENLRSKRRRLNKGFPVPTYLKYEAAHRHDFYSPKEQFAFTEENQGSSAMSSRSKCESWETYSNSPSCKEEHLQGSLAISTTSFDSYLEHFDKGNWDCSESKKKCNSRMQKRRDQPPTDGDVLPQSTAKHLIVNVERKNSDGEIVDFMDREPQTQVIPSSGSYQKWQPLCRQSKTKRKKPENDCATTGYYLRSSSREPDALERTHPATNRQECKSSTLQVEVGIQVEEMNQQIQCPALSDSHMESPLDTCHQHVLHQTQEEPSCDMKLSLQRMQPPSREPSSDLEPPVEPPQTAQEQEQQQQQQPEYFEGQEEDAGLGLLGEHSDLSSAEFMGGFPHRFQGPSDSHQPQDKEYIFGPRNSTSGLGESCEFSFGLKWALSDDED